MLIYLLYAVLGLAVFFYLFISFLAARTVRELADGIEINPVNLDADYPDFVEGVEECNRWAETQNFQRYGAYTTTISNIENVFIAWKHQTRPTYFIRYHAGGKVFYDFVSLYLGRYALTTSGSKDSQMLPRPCGIYMQSFDGDLPALQARHAEAESFLMREAGLKEQWVERPLTELINESVVRQARYTQTLPLWQFRGFWWFLVRRGSLHGRSVEELHKDGLAPFPGDRNFREYNS